MKPNEHEDPPIEGGYTGFPKQRSCNRHDNCDVADAAMVEKGHPDGAAHCHIEDCEECFGT